MATGLFIDLNPTFHDDGDDLLTEYIRTIRKQNLNILSTPIGSVYFEPQFGSQCSDYIFDPLTETTAWKIETAAYYAIRRWQPRIILDEKESRVYVDEARQGWVGTFAYTILATNQKVSQQVLFQHA